MANSDRKSSEFEVEGDDRIKIEHRNRSVGFGSVSRDAFDRRVSQSLLEKPRAFSRSSFSNTHLSMIAPDVTHLEVTDDCGESNSIDDMGAGWYVWLCAITASIAGSLFGYDTGIISAVLVYLGTSLNGRETTSSEKEAITSLCSTGAFIGAIISGLTADKVYERLLLRTSYICKLDTNLTYSTVAKKVIYVGCTLFTVGAILQGTAYSFTQMVAGCLIV